MALDRLGQGVDTCIISDRPIMLFKRAQFCIYFCDWSEVGVCSDKLIDIISLISRMSRGGIESSIPLCKRSLSIQQTLHCIKLLQLVLNIIQGSMYWVILFL